MGDPETQGIVLDGGPWDPGSFFYRKPRDLVTQALGRGPLDPWLWWRVLGSKALSHKHYIGGGPWDPESCHINLLRIHGFLPLNWTT